MKVAIIDKKKRLTLWRNFTNERRGRSGEGGGGGASGKIFKMISLTIESDIDTFSFLTFL